MGLEQGLLDEIAGVQFGRQLEVECEALKGRVFDTRWETPSYVQQSDRPGPIVMLVGGMHGDEPAGAAAAEQIRHWPITRGTLAVLPRANAAGLAQHSRNMPSAPKDWENLNRDFPKAGHPGPATEGPARAIWNWTQSLQPTWVVDLHEGTNIRAAGSKSVGSSVIVCSSPEAEAAASRMLQAVNMTIKDPKKHFVRLTPPVNGSLVRAAAEHLHARAMILETSIHDLPRAPTKDPSSSSKNGDRSLSQTKVQPLSQRVRQQRSMIGALLKHLEMIDPSLDVDLLAGRGSAPDKTWVALYDAGGTGGKGGTAVELVLARAGMRVVHLGPEEIAAGTLSQFHLAIVPGGSGSREAKAMGEQGRRQMKQFVEHGGGYLGICAGAYLCTSGFEWGLKILKAKTVSPRWQRGEGMVKMELTPAGRRILGDRTGLLDVRYANGPIITRANDESLPDYEVLACFRTELSNNGTSPGEMLNSPAIAAGKCGRGRVVFISPHPEQTPGLEDFIRRAALWAVGGEGMNGPDP